MHLSFWCLYFSFFFYQITFFRHKEDLDLGRALVDALTHIAFMASVSYLNYFIWLPRFLKHKNLLRYIIEFTIPFAIIVTLHILFKRFLYSEFIEQGKFLLMKVPSAVVPGDYNLLINPSHQDMKMVRIIRISDFTFDERLVGWRKKAILCIGHSVQWCARLNSFQIPHVAQLT